MEEVPACARAHGARIRPAVRADTYQPAPARRPESPKRPGKGPRGLGMPTGVARSLPHASAPGRGPRVDPEVSAASCGCRPGRAAPQAGQQRPSYSKTGDRRAGERDRAQVFARVNPPPCGPAGRARSALRRGGA